MPSHQIEAGDEELDEFAKFLQVRFAERGLTNEIADRRAEGIGASHDGGEAWVLAAPQAAQSPKRKPAMTMASIVFVDTLIDDLSQPFHPFDEIA